MAANILRILGSWQVRRHLPYGSIVALFFVAGCSSLPTIVPDLERRSGPPVQLDVAHGELPAVRSEAILEGLQYRSQDTGIFEHHLAREEAIVGSPLTAGNRVHLLQDGPATYQAMYAAIMAARDHINMETYILDDDEVGQRFAEALIARQAEGVQVNLIRDSVGTLGTPTEFFQKLIDSGIQVLEFNPINPLMSRKEWTLNQRDHRKLLIIDGHTAFLGGINISSVYSSGSFRKASRAKSNTGSDPALAWRDTDLQLQGPVVAEFQKLFLAAWEKQKGEPLTGKNYFPPPENVGPHRVRAIGSSPDDAFSLIYVTLLSAISSSEASVNITNAYFAPDPQLLDALEAAAGRGVDVNLILPSQTDSWLVFHAGRNYYDRLLQAGVKIHERRGVILHSKTALIDGVWATVGSTNLDWRSFLHNYELNAVVLGPDFGEQVQAMFDRDLAMSDTITLEQWRRRPLDQRFSEWFARVWEYWL
ncbi:MAG: phospholipase D-like domain-containing protein [Thiobacillus sp.]|uniref:phospholipase D-like domain-containing protein n=1 Tax=Thiobacillus sp. TaxID=924 RepID=UPI0027357E1D|nr:phospholipase D-like domain-containing protein [Thiobacillus sp.]MDP3585258.1 phospholipase D-like domain-containing protein [Thiobacillus sp.]